MLRHIWEHGAQTYVNEWIPKMRRNRQVWIYVWGFMHVDRRTDVKASVSVCTQKKACVCTVKIPTKGKSGPTITGKIKAPPLKCNLCYRRFRCFDKQHNNVTDLSNFTTMPVPSQAVTAESRGEMLYIMLFYWESPFLTFGWIKMEDWNYPSLCFATMKNRLWFLLTWVSLCIQQFSNELFIWCPHCGITATSCYCQMVQPGILGIRMKTVWVNLDLVFYKDFQPILTICWLTPKRLLLSKKTAIFTFSCFVRISKYVGLWSCGWITKVQWDERSPPPVAS